MTTSKIIPKIIHQLWIGTKPAPKTLMDTWREKNPDFEYIFWNEDEFLKRNIYFKCQEKIDDIEEINGKADIIRWELLYKFGGIFIDADSICIEPIDDELINKKCFAGWEQEEVRLGLIATGTMGFPPKHPLVKNAIKWILNNDVSQNKANLMAWQSVGPGLLTRMYNTGEYKDIHIFPSYTFLPIHLTGLEYKGHGKIYAFQAWGSTKQSYDSMNNLGLPDQFLYPNKDKSVSILISSFNTSAKYIKECLDSIKNQIGYFNIEVVWINDGSDELHSKLLKKLLDNFVKSTRFITLIYNENDSNKGIGYSLHKGIHLCNNEIIIKMDSDDIMVNNRIIKQYDFMENNHDIKICGCQINSFKDDISNIIMTTQHPSITWKEYKEKPTHWFVNHPTLCYRKSAILEIGNYDYNKSHMVEDFDMELRMLKKYEKIINLPEALLYYRLHDKQITHNGGSEGRSHWNEIRTNLINEIINT
jgi:GT2 family glycosyltransferase